MAKKKKLSFKEKLHYAFTGRVGGYVIITLIFTALLLFYPGNNLFTWIKARYEIKEQEKLMRKYQIEIMEMDARIKELCTNRDTLEKFARENFHFAKPGEDIYLLE